MKIAVISDLHLSPPGPACVFTHTEADFLTFLDRVEAASDVLALCGDVYDCDVGERFGDHAGALEAARLAWPRLVPRLERPGVLMVFGNHDAILAAEGIPGVQSLDVGGRRIEIRHGHTLGPLSNRLDAVKYPIKWLAALDQRRGPGLLGRALYGVNDALTQPSALRKHHATDKHAMAHLKACERLDILVCGHVHRPLVELTDGGTYANSGTCGYGRLDWLLIDTETGTVEVRSG